MQAWYDCEAAVMEMGRSIVCIKHMSTMLEKGPPKGNFWESYSALYNNSPVNSAMFRNNTQKDKRQQQREQYSADTQQALKDGAPEWLAQRSKDTRDRMDELVMESTNVITMSLTDEAKGHIQGLFLISPNQLDDMIGWIHSKYTGAGQDQTNSQTPIEANSSQQPGASNPQLHSQTAQSTQGPAPERQPLDLFSLRHKDTAPNSTRTGQPDRAQPVQQQQPHTPQQASPMSVQASQASRSAQSDAGQSSGAPKTQRRTGNGDNDGLPPRPFNIWDNLELPDDQTQRDQAPRDTTLLNISAGTAPV